MKHLILLFSLLFAVSSFADETSEKGNKLPDKAVCIVCHPSGEGEQEPVHAESIYDGKRYYFCNDGCKKKFDADPTSYQLVPIPRPFPSITLIPLAGDGNTPTALPGIGDKVFLIDVWATWCKPCEKLIPKLMKLRTELAGKNIEVIGMAIDEEGRAKVAPYVIKKKIDYPIYLDTNAEAPAWKALGVKAVPTLLLVDGQGQIVKQWSGDPNFEEIKQAALAASQAK